MDDSPSTLRVYWRADRQCYRADIRYTDPRTGARRRVRRTLTATRKKEADAEARALLQQLSSRMGGAEKRAALSGLAKKWFAQQTARLKPNTRKAYDLALRVHIVPWFLHVDVRRIDAEAVAAFQAHLAGQLSAKSVNNTMGVLSKLLEDGATWGYLASNPVKAVPRLTLPVRTPAWWEPEDSERFLATVRESEPAYELLFTLALRTGLRWGELAALRWEDVVLRENDPHLVVRRSWDPKEQVDLTPKSNRIRRVPLPASAVALLTEAREGRSPSKLERVLSAPSDPGAPIARTTVRKALTRLAKAAKVPHLRVHDLRHTYCSQLVAAGVAISYVQQWAGHADIQTTMRYAHLSPLSNSAAVAVLDRASESKRPQKGPSGAATGPDADPKT